ncbi:ribonuclease H-like domain-containing protein [Tanacetum coccineum]
MRPFGCPLTILNTLDSLGKFDGKSDEGYLLGYSTTSKAFRVYNKRTKRVEENLHINFLEDQPNVAGTGPNWMFDLDFLTNSMNYIPVSAEKQVNMNAGTQDSYVAGSSGKDKEPTQEYILLPLHPHRTRIPVEDVAPAAHGIPSESSPKDNDVKDSEDVADKEGQHQLTEDEQVLHDDLEKMIAQEVIAKALDDATRQAFEEDDESDTESEDITEAEKKFKMLANDEEIARKVQEEWEAEESKKRLAEEEATMAAFTNEYDFIQARLNADKILTEKLQEEEREKFTIEQRDKFLYDTIAVQRRFLAQQRFEAIRNKLPTRNQLRNQMMTYLKHVGGYKHAQLNKKKFEEIQVMYDKVKRENERFIPIGSAEDDKLIDKMNKKAAGVDKEEVAKELENSKVERPKENIRKRSRRRLKMKAPKRSKRRKTDSDHEEENQLRIFLKIVHEEEEKIDYEILGTRYPIINWESKFYDYGHSGRELIYYIVFRADGSSRWIKTFSEMIKLFDKTDLTEIHSLVMKRFETTPPEGIDLLLWGDLRTMFESKEDDELCKNQEEWKLQSWIFYENCRVHVLRLEDGTDINMLAERIYPLTKHTLERMLD